MKKFTLLAGVLLFPTASIFTDTKTDLQTNVTTAVIRKTLADRKVAKKCTDKQIDDWLKSANWILKTPRLKTDIPDQSPEFMICGSALIELSCAHTALDKAQTQLREYNIGKLIIV